MSPSTLKLDSILLALKPETTDVWLSPQLEWHPLYPSPVMNDGLTAYFLCVFTLKKSKKSFDKLVLSSTCRLCVLVEMDGRAMDVRESQPPSVFLGKEGREPMRPLGPMSRGQAQLLLLQTDKNHVTPKCRWRDTRWGSCWFKAKGGPQVVTAGLAAQSRKHDGVP